MEHLSGFVSIMGSPNVGKSTLMNALVGEKVAIVTKKAQTTRNKVAGILTRPQYQIVFLDTYYESMKKSSMLRAGEEIKSALNQEDFESTLEQISFLNSESSFFLFFRNIASYIPNTASDWAKDRMVLDRSFSPM